MKVIIIGGGFAGVNLALSLAHNLKFQVTLVDKNDYHLFSPFLYQVTSSFLKPSDISIPFLKLFSGKDNLSFHLGELEKIVPAGNKVVLDNAILEYDYLVLATGSFNDFPFHENIKKTAFPMKTLDDALILQGRLKQKVEKAKKASLEADRRKALTFVVAGGGPGGVEAAAMLAEILNRRLPGSETSFLKSEIYLIEKEAAILPFMDKKSQQRSFQYLSDLGVVIKKNTSFQGFCDDVVFLSGNEKIIAENLIWTAGVKARKITGLEPEVYRNDNRIIVDAYNKVQGTYNIFGIGDTCFQPDPENPPDGYPQVAQVALQQGINLAKNFQLMAEREKLKAFTYNDQGTSVSIGRMKAVASLYKSRLHLSGSAAWFAWLFLHLAPMIQSGNRFRLFGRSIQGYFRRDRI
jgi:NADH dehydrogenase